MRYSIACPSIRNEDCVRSKRFAGRDPKLFGDKIDAGHHLRHRMLDLQARIHLQEIEFTSAADEFDRAGVAVTRGARDAGRDITNATAFRLVERRRRCLLDDFLKAPLHRAFAVEEMHHVTVGVSKDLHFDVTRTLDIPFDIEAAVAEITRAFAAGAQDLIIERRIFADDAHSLAAAARGRFDQ